MSPGSRSCPSRPLSWLSRAHHSLPLAVAGLLEVAPVLAAPAADAIPASASPVEPAATAPAVPHEPQPTQIIALNPVFVAFGTLSAEVEFRVTRLASLGVSGWYEYADVRARWAYLKALIYPWQEAPSGLGVGLTAGFLRAYADPGDLDSWPRASAPTVGLMAEYNYLLGPHRHCLLGVGIGGRTPLVHISDASPLHRLDGDVRLVAGVAF